MDLETTTAIVIGSNAVFAAALRAIIATHPDQTALSQALEHHLNLQLSALTVTAAPDAALDAFHLQRDQIRPD